MFFYLTLGSFVNIFLGVLVICESQGKFNCNLKLIIIYFNLQNIHVLLPLGTSAMCCVFQ